MKKKNYTENDEIELRLVHYVQAYYNLEWRFKESRKFLCFKLKDKWRTLCVYSNSLYSPEDDPNDDFYWSNVYFNMGRKSDVQEYECLKNKVRTKKDLFDYYQVQNKVNLYYDHMKQHRKWIEETNNNIKKFVK